MKASLAFAGAVAVAIDSYADLVALNLQAWNTVKGGGQHGKN